MVAQALTRWTEPGLQALWRFSFIGARLAEQAADV
jgi:hypothetical protein